MSGDHSGSRRADVLALEAPHLIEPAAELNRERDAVRTAASTLRLALDVGREQLAGGAKLTASMWATIDGLAEQLEDALGVLEAAERRAGLR